MEPYRKNRNPSGPRLATRESYWVTWTQADLEKDGGRRGCRNRAWGLEWWLWGVGVAFGVRVLGLGFRVKGTRV